MDSGVLDKNRLAINQIAKNSLPLSQAVAAYAAAGPHGITPWRDKIEQTGVTTSKNIITDAGLAVTGYDVASLVTRKGVAARQMQINDARRANDMAAAIGASSGVTVIGEQPLADVLRCIIHGCTTTFGSQ